MIIVGVIYGGGGNREIIPAKKNGNNPIENTWSNLKENVCAYKYIIKNKGG